MRRAGEFVFGFLVAIVLMIALLLLTRPSPERYVEPERVPVMLDTIPRVDPDSVRFIHPGEKP